jgi:cell division septation protein DedD
MTTVTPTPPPARQLPLSRLGHLVPPLLEGQALIALVPLTDDLPWAAKAAWDIARIAARDGRRIALIDLNLERPVLHELTGLQPAEGIVDAFEYGVSLNKAAHEVMGVFFIPAGSETAQAPELYANPRWAKLQAGFRSEGALLFAFVSLSGLSQLSAAVDGAFVLAPEGVTPGFTLARDIPLFGVVRDRWLPAATHRPSPPGVAMPIVVEPRKRRGLRAVLVAFLVAALAVGGWALLARAREAIGERAHGLTAPSAPPQTPPPAPTSTSPQPQPSPARDTLGWTVRLAAYASLDKALAHADRLAADDGVPTLVTPVPQSENGPVWYRVLAGSYATRTAAAEARGRLWRRGVVSEGIGDLLLAPLSYQVPAGTSLESLRRRGLPAIRWSNGVILLGAFEASDQAAYTQAALKRAGVRANLLPRMGTP